MQSGYRIATLQGSNYATKPILVPVDDGAWPAVIYVPASLTEDQILKVHHVAAAVEPDTYKGWRFLLADDLGDQAVYEWDATWPGVIAGK